MISNSEKNQKIIRLKEVRNRTGLSKSTLYERICQGSFPSPINLGARAVGWVESEINDWISKQIELSRRGSNEKTKITSRCTENLNCNGSCLNNEQQKTLKIKHNLI